MFLCRSEKPEKVDKSAIIPMNNTTQRKSPDKNAPFLPVAEEGSTTTAPFMWVTIAHVSSLNQGESHPLPTVGGSKTIFSPLQIM